MNPNIAALQAAERLLRDHDAKVKEASEELSRLKKARVPILATVQECIDVLCGRKSPDLFASVDAPRPEPKPKNDAGPIVCAPVGKGKLADIPGLTKGDISRLSEVNIHTLSELENECDGDLNALTDCLIVCGFTEPEAQRIQQAIESYLRLGKAPEPAKKTKAIKKRTKRGLLEQTGA